MMNWHTIQQRASLADPRAAAIGLGAAVVLGCALWLASPSGPLAPGPRTPASELMQEVGWIDQRLAAAEGPGAVDNSPAECRIAALHWDRATRLAQTLFYREFGKLGTDEREPDYRAFRRRCLQKDASGDVAATREFAARALALTPPGQARVRPLWFLSVACAAGGQWEEATGALVEITRYKPAQAWVWRLLGEAYGARGDWGRQDLAEEQAWRANTGRPLSASISTVLRRTPYARPAVSPAGRAQRIVSAAAQETPG